MKPKVWALYQWAFVSTVPCSFEPCIDSNGTLQAQVGRADPESRIEVQEGRMCHLVASSKSALSRIREVEEGSSRDRKSEEFGPGVTAGPISFCPPRTYHT